MWAVPLLVTPPLFSRDVYSYLAIGSMMREGFNPYDSGPYDTLGDSDAVRPSGGRAVAAHRQSRTARCTC